MTKKEIVLSRDAILKAPDLPLIKVDVPEWGGVVYVRGLDGTERDRFETDAFNSSGANKLKNLRAKLISIGLVDEDNKPLFSKTDIDALGKKSGKVLDRLFDVISKESGLLNKDVEELVKNYVSDLKDDSISS